MTPTPYAPRYFPGLDGLRAYAAVSVLVSHLGRDTDLLSWPFLSGSDGVTCFFVLSGFLITYLLLTELRATGTIHVRAFYARRILRIWPLYYLIAAVGLWLLPALLGSAYRPHTVPLEAQALTLFLLPNVARAFYSVTLTSHLWSLGLEEQFYAIWPHVVKLTSARRWLLPIIGAVLAARLLVAPFITPDAYARNPALIELLAGLRVEAMALGALAAYAYVRRWPGLRLVYRRSVQLMVLVLVGAMAVLPVPEPHGLYMAASAVVFAALILNVGTNPASIVKLDRPALVRLGGISYGLYMVHVPVREVFLALTVGRDAATAQAMTFVGTVAFTLALAALSYEYVEKPFLKLKGRYAAPTLSTTPAAAGN
jgi:peptidoglycan/LPS O-acetylase OafA/YrhL